MTNIVYPFVGQSHRLEMTFNLASIKSDSAFLTFYMRFKDVPIL